MELSTRENGKAMSGMVMEYRYGQMEPSIKVFGRMEKQQAKESLYT